jgi:GNAT superfamily N-acetyltransferase
MHSNVSYSNAPVTTESPVRKGNFFLREVNDADSSDLFLDMPSGIYKDDPHWIPYIQQEVAAVFDPKKNPYFNHGEAIRWVLLDERGRALGRIAAFIDFHKMFDTDKKIGEIGFFESVYDQNVAFTLFDTAVKWLTEKFNVTVVDGPVNFGENDKFWGLKIKGNGYPSYGMTYNPAYYRYFFEEYGFEIQYRQFTNYLDLQSPLRERFRTIAERVSRNPQYTFRHFEHRYRDRFARDFVEVYNRAWANFKSFVPMDDQMIMKTIEEMKPVMEEKFIWFAYVNGTPAGFLVGVPDVNQILRYSGANFDWWGKAKFGFFRLFKRFTAARVVVMGVVPEFQRHGLESALILRAFEAGRERNYKHVQLAWVGDFNDKMIAIHKAMGAVEDKVHATYRKKLNGEG